MKEKLALKISERGVVEELSFTNENSLKVLQSAVDGLIEPVDISDTVTCWVNEEGLFRSDFQLNIFASGTTGLKLKGPAVFTGGVGENGETLSLSYEDAEIIRQKASVAEKLCRSVGLLEPETN